MPTKSEVGKLTSEMTKAEFAEELSSLTTLTADEVKNLFPNKTDRQELIELLKIVKSSADENTKKAKLIAQISNVSGAVLKIAGRLAGP